MVKGDRATRAARCTHRDGHHRIKPSRSTADRHQIGGRGLGRKGVDSCPAQGRHHERVVPVAPQRLHPGDAAFVCNVRKGGLSWPARSRCHGHALASACRRAVACKQGWSGRDARWTGTYQARLRTDVRPCGSRRRRRHGELAWLLMSDVCSTRAGRLASEACPTGRHLSDRVAPSTSRGRRNGCRYCVARARSLVAFNEQTGTAKKCRLHDRIHTASARLRQACPTMISSGSPTTCGQGGKRVDAKALAKAPSSTARQRRLPAASTRLLRSRSRPLQLPDNPQRPQRQVVATRCSSSAILVGVGAMFAFASAGRGRVMLKMPAGRCRRLVFLPRRIPGRLLHGRIADNFGSQRDNAVWRVGTAVAAAVAVCGGLLSPTGVPAVLNMILHFNLGSDAIGAWVVAFRAFTFAFLCHVSPTSSRWPRCGAGSRWSGCCSAFPRRYTGVC